MPEELRITINDTGTTGGATAPSTGATRAPSVSAGRGGSAALVGGVALAAVTAGVAAIPLALNKIDKTIQKQGDVLQGLSAPIASAQAQIGIQRERALQRRAQEIGPELARALRIRAEAEDQLFDVNTKILETILSTVDVIDTAAIAIATIFPQTMGLMAKIHNIIKRADERAEDQEQDDFTQQFMDLLPRGNDDRPLFWPGGLEEPI